MNVPAFKKTVDDIISKINRGLFQPGEQIYSRKEICSIYNVSNMTAYKVHSELQRAGVVKTIPGKGLFANVLSTNFLKDSSPQTIDKICFIAGENTIGHGKEFGNRLIDGIRQRTNELNLNLRIECINTSPYGDMINRKVLSFAPNEGFITFAHIYPEMLMPLTDPSISKVLVNRIFPGCRSVLTDNYDGIQSLLKFIVNKGHRHIVLASGFSASSAEENENERIYFFEKEAINAKIKWQIISSGNYYDLLELLKGEDPPSAIMFTSDDSALKFIDILNSKNMKKNIQITGFDDIATETAGLENMTTYHIDCEKMGMAAVDTLVSTNIENMQKYLYKRIPGKLVVRN